MQSAGYSISITFILISLIGTPLPKAPFSRKQAGKQPPEECVVFRTPVSGKCIRLVLFAFSLMAGHVTFLQRKPGIIHGQDVREEARVLQRREEERGEKE